MKTRSKFMNYQDSLRGLERFEDSIGQAARVDVAYDMAEIVKDRAVALAPRGKTGNLKRGIVAKKFKAPGPSQAFVAVDYSIAPHAHLVEFGHNIVVGGRRRVGETVKRGRRVYGKGKVVGYVPARSFLRKAVKETSRGRESLLKQFGIDVLKIHNNG